jgi:hypothetical protein
MVEAVYSFGSHRPPYPLAECHNYLGLVNVSMADA